MQVCLLFSYRSEDSVHSHANITAWFPRLHALVVGPGLGRDANIMKTVKVGNDGNLGFDALY